MMRLTIGAVLAHQAQRNISEQLRSQPYQALYSLVEEVQQEARQFKCPPDYHDVIVAIDLGMV